MRKALAIGDPMIALGFLGIPAHLLTGDPVATFNFALGAVTWIAAFAMYLLVKSWTGVPAAGIVAGLVYAFHRAKVVDVVHPYIADTAWTVLALLFAQRLFERGRWRDALGLAACCAMQMAECFYPFLAAVFIAIPFGLWLVFHYRFKGLRLGPLIVALALIGLSALAIFGPYLEMLGAAPSRRHVFAYWQALGPGRLTGWPCYLLALLALAAPRRMALGGLAGDPRWALLTGLLLVAVMACGGGRMDQLAAALGHPTPFSWLVFPNLYRALAEFVPGMSKVRAPVNLLGGAQVILGVLAGLGAAASIRFSPRRWVPFAAVALIALAYVDTLRPRFLGFEPLRFDSFRVRPAEGELEFYRRLEALGNAGPLLEYPINRKNIHYTLVVSSTQTLLSAYHHRRTSACSMSFAPPAMAEVEEASRLLPTSDGVAAAREMGFTTIVVRHGPGTWAANAIRQRFEVAASGPSAELRRIHGTPDMSAYEILPPKPSPKVEERATSRPRKASNTTP